VIHIEPDQVFPLQTLMLKMDPARAGKPCNAGPKVEFLRNLTQLSQPLNRQSAGKPSRWVQNTRKTPIYAPNCSVNLFSNLFKSLSFLRTTSIFSTEWRTVVWCLPPN
jgi:hypothetical protein